MSTTPSAHVAVVTGAARGVGLEIAHRFQAENYHVIALVNNAEIAIFKPAEQVTFEDWKAVMSTNLNGTFLCSPATAYINGQILAVDGGFDAAGVGLPSLRR